MPRVSDPTSVPPKEALQRLMDGNARFRNAAAFSEAEGWSAELAGGQHPFAIILGCSDSRTPVEFLFDQGFGQLFVVRVAGNIVEPSIVGSIEFAAAEFGTRLVVVMGHTLCGAIAATVRSIEKNQSSESENLRAITGRIAPNIESLVNGSVCEGDLQRRAMRANVRASVERVRSGSPLMDKLVRAGRVVIVGAEYELETGAVHFFHGLEALSAEP